MNHQVEEVICFQKIEIKTIFSHYIKLREIWNRVFLSCPKISGTFSKPVCHIKNTWFLTHSIKTLCHRNNSRSRNDTMRWPKSKNSTIRGRNSNTSSSVGSWKSEFLVLQQKEARNTKDRTTRNNLPKEKSARSPPTTIAEPLDDPPGTLSGAHGFMGVP